MMVDIVIVDRERPSYVFDAKVIRRVFAKDYGEGFALWLASPAPGRFLVVDHSVTAVEEKFTNCETEEAVIGVVTKKYAAATTQAEPCTVNVTAFVPQELHARLGGIGREVDASRAEQR